MPVDLGPAVSIPTQWLFGGLQLLIAGGVGWIVRAVGDIRAELRRLNGRMIAVETWKLEHDRIDEATRDEVREIRADLHRAITTHALANGKD